MQKKKDVIRVEGIGGKPFLSFFAEDRLLVKGRSASDEGPLAGRLNQKGLIMPRIMKEPQWHRNI